MTTQTVNVDAFGYTGTFSAKLRDPDTIATLVATADTVVASGTIASRFVCTFGEVSVIPAGEYLLEFVVNGTSYILYVTLTGVDGEVALARSERAVELDSTATAALVDLIWDEPLTKATHNVATSSGKRLRQTTAFQQIDSTVIDAAATTTTFVTDLTSPVDNFYNDSMLVFTDGALAGQVRAIYDYIGATKTIVLEEALTSAPVNGVAFVIVSLHIHPVSKIQSGLATSAELVTLRGADNDTLKTLSDQIDTVSADVSSIASVSREAF